MDWFLYDRELRHERVNMYPSVSVHFFHDILLPQMFCYEGLSHDIETSQIV